MGVKQNLNLYLLAGTALAVWMLLVHAPQYLSGIYVSPMLVVHLIGVYPIYLACIHNTLITPTTFPWARNAHVWVGRIGLIMGVVGFISGAVLAWYLDFDPDELGFSIGITVGGAVQVIAQFIGFRAIKRHQKVKQELVKVDSEAGSDERIDELKKERDEALLLHIRCMLAVFFLGCGIPSIMRIPVGANNDWVTYVLIAVSVALYFLCSRTLRKRVVENSDRKKIAVDGSVVEADGKSDRENVDRATRTNDPGKTSSVISEGI